MICHLQGKDFMRILLGSVLAIIIAFLSSVCGVTGYATYKGFQARGAPDQAVINEFAEKSVEWITAVFMGVGTFLGGLIATIKAKSKVFLLCILIGLVVAITGFIFGLIGGLNLWTFVGAAAAMTGGLLVGVIKKPKLP